MTMYKALLRPHLDYGDITHDEAYNETFHQKLESIQYLLGDCKKKNFTIRLVIPPTLMLVQETLLIL